MVTLNLNDLAHILEQIKIAEAHSAAIGDSTDPEVARSALEALITNPLIPTGLRTVSGTLNNYQTGFVNNGTADQWMQRLLTPEFKAAELNREGQPTSYAQTSGSVYDSQPRTISNLIADQTLGNIAAISAALQIAGVTGVENLNLSKEIHAAYEAAKAQEAATSGLNRTQLESALATEKAQLLAAETAAETAATAAATADLAVETAQGDLDAAQAALDLILAGLTEAEQGLVEATAAFSQAALANQAAVAAASEAADALSEALVAEGAAETALSTAQSQLSAAVSVAADTELDRIAAQDAFDAADLAVEAANTALLIEIADGDNTDDQAALDAYSAALTNRTAAQSALNIANAADAEADAAVTAAHLAVSDATTALAEAEGALAAAVLANSEAAATAAAASEALAEAIAAQTAAQQAVDAETLAIDAKVLAAANTAVSAAQDELGLAADAQALAQQQLQSAEALVAEETADVAEAQAALAPFAAQYALEAKLEEHGIQMDGDNVFLGNVSADLGDTAPFNSFFTIFGQFFDHGLDLTQKGGNGSVFMMLKPDDPLYEPGSPTNFMVLTRATNQPGDDGVLGTADDVRENANETTPWIDLNQLYTSNPSHQVFLREYVLINDRPQATGRMLEGATGGAPTWADIKAQARDVLGIQLSDLNVHSVPAIVTDLYGEFVRGPNGFPQLATPTGPLEGSPSAPVNAAVAFSAGRAFLNDIAHAADPGLVDHDRNPATPMIQKLADVEGDGDPDIGGPQEVNAFGVSLTYDNELLDRHFIVGDGRGNENIALTAIHTVFHGEHNRQIEAVQDTLLSSGDFALLQEYTLGTQTQAQLAAMKSDYAALKAAATTPAGEAALAEFVNSLPWDGERLFQTARFSTEMVYQHLVFEEFVRSIAPQIDPFVFSNSVEIPVGISQEFAQVVYRFGHSMLNETVDMVGLLVSAGVLGETGPVGMTSVDLFDAFLNPVMFDAQGIDAHAAAGAILRGMTRQHGNEIDEFLTDALRNNLVGLPLDLAALNIARARETGIPSLNEARSQFFEQTGNTYIKPYESWTDFAANIKTPLSVVNFIAAYGLHETITGATTMAAKRDAAMALVLGGPGAPADRLDFLNATGAWATEETGLNNVDFWIGGLAEAKMSFGGMLGSTFTFVFEAQMEALQNGDRFYYLSRTQGMNLLTQLESDSFADLIQRNTDGEHKGLSINGAAFQTAAWVLEINQARQYNAGLGNADPTREMDVLSSMNGTDSLVVRGENYLKFLGGEHVVIGGTQGDDTIVGGAGDDGLWGYDGDDDIEGGFGVDHIHGGDGSDLITDMGTDVGDADVLKGEGGDDLINGGMGLDLIFGGDGSDVLAGGSEAKDIFGGQGDDFIRAPSGGGGVVYGNEGNDWMEGQGNMNTLTGDNSELFFNSRIIGHDVMHSGENDTDFDAESGDDIMVQGIGINRNNGMSGFDWTTFQGNEYAADADMNISIFVNQQNNILRDRYDLVEGLSGWNYSDTLRGRDAVLGAYDVNGNATQVSNTAPIESFSNALLEKNLDLITGLRELVAHLERFEIRHPTLGTDEVQIGVMDTSDASDIILGGGGSDVIEGRAGNDIIDGDKYLNVRIGIADAAGNAWATATKLTAQVTTLTGEVLFGGRSLENLLFSREIAPSQLSIVREILNGGAAGDVDTAVYWDVRDNYEIVRNADGSVTVSHVTASVDLVDPVTGVDLSRDPATGRGRGLEGTDRLTNVETLRFADGEIFLEPRVATGAPIILDVSPTETEAVSVDLSSIVDLNGIASIAVQWQQSTNNGTTWTNINGATEATYTPPPRNANQQPILRVQATVTDEFGGVTVLRSAATDRVGEVLNGNGNANTITGTVGGDRITGNNGNDVINAGASDDVIIWNVGNGRDDIDGGTETAIGDTVIINGNNQAETYRVYSVTAWQALGGNRNVPNGTEIIITRNGTANNDVIAWLQEIEEIVINTAGGNDQVLVIGDFTPTSLSFSTITIEGSDSDDTVNISGLESAHRILFRSNGGNDFVVGALRAQDVIEIAEGADPAAFTGTDNGDGTITMSDGTHSITFTGSMDNLPTLSPKGTHQPGEGEGDGSSGTNDDQTDDEAEDADDDNPGAGSGSDTDSGTGSGSGNGNGNGSGTGSGTVTPVEGVVLMPGSTAGVMVGDAGDDVIVGGEQGDALLGKGGADIILGNGGNDVGVGGSGDDVIEGGAGRDVLLGGDGDDVFLGQSGDGADMLFGGAGSDTLDLSALTEDAVIDLGAYTAIGTARIGGVTDHLVSIENVIGGTGNDVIKASLSINVLTGGDGEDVFVFTSAGTADGDVITDFRPGDRIDLSGIDAHVGLTGNQAFTLADQGTTAAGSLVIREVATADGVDTIIDGFTDGDDEADFSITLRGAHNLDGSSFTF